jgi:hypothetical protein
LQAVPETVQITDPAPLLGWKIAVNCWVVATSTSGVVGKREMVMGFTPVPVSATVWTEPAAPPELSETDSVADLEPLRVGAKVIWITQELFGASEKAGVHVVPEATAKSAEAEPEIDKGVALRERLASPVLVSVTVCALLTVDRF